MPWTLAHPAAILPLTRFCPRWPSLPALVVGSLTPDLGCYVGAFGFATRAHSMAGSLLLCLPSGLALLALLTMLRRPLSFLLPLVAVLHVRRFATS